jgi:hypothetical protein
MNKQEVELLSKEIEMLMGERAVLLKVVGAAAMLVANIDPASLRGNALNVADRLSESLNALSEETLRDALEATRGQAA